MTNADYWDAHSAAYPYHAVQGHIPDPIAPKPEQLDIGRYGPVLRVPILNNGMPAHVLWGFKTEAGRDLFLTDFGAAFGVGVFIGSAGA